MNTWLIGFAVEISGVEMMVYQIVLQRPRNLPSRGMMMGRNWWEDGKTVHEGYRWRWPFGSVWFNSIILLDDVESSILRGLKFLDAWPVTGTVDEPIIWGSTPESHHAKCE